MGRISSSILLHSGAAECATKQQVVEASGGGEGGGGGGGRGRGGGEARCCLRINQHQDLVAKIQPFVTHILDWPLVQLSPQALFGFPVKLGLARPFKCPLDKTNNITQTRYADNAMVNVVFVKR